MDFWKGMVNKGLHSTCMSPSIDISFVDSGPVIHILPLYIIWIIHLCEFTGYANMELTANPRSCPGFPRTIHPPTRISGSQ